MLEITEKPSSRAGLFIILAVIVCTAVLIVHWPSLSANAMLFDDEQYLAENMLVQNPGWDSAQRFLTEVLEPSTVDGYYQPLTMISLMVDYAVGGRPDNLMPFHRTSLILHMSNTLLIMILLYLLFGRAWIAAVIGLLFGLHPMTVETIAWVGERKTLLAAFFAFLSLIFYVRAARSNKRGFYFGSIVMYVLALMSKPTSTPLPIIMLLMDYWPLKRFNRRAVFEKIPFFVVGAVSAIITYISQSRTAQVSLPAEYGPWRVPLIICHNIVFYLYKIIWPVNLSSHYPYPVTFSLSDPMLLAGVIGTCVLIALLIISLHWTRAVLICFSVFFVGLLPTMQIIGFSNVIASDKFAYLPSIGLLILLSAAVCWFVSTKKPFLSRILIVIVVLIISSAEAVGTRKYLTYWRSSISYSEYVLSLAPDSAPMNMMMGYAYQKEGELDKAVAYYSRALEISPGFVDAINNLALTLKLQGNLNEAADYYRKAVQAEPDNADLHYNLGNTCQSLGNFDEAIYHYYQALKIKPGHVHTHLNLANALAAQGRYDEALEHYRKIINIRPLEATVRYNIGLTLQEQGKLDEAIDYYTKAILIKPDFSEAHYSLIYTFDLQNKLDEAMNYYQQVLRMKLNEPEMHNLFGVGLQSRGELDKAITQFQLAIQANPDFVEAYRNLAMLYESQDKIEDAVAQYRKVLQLKPEDTEIHLKAGNLLASQNRIDEAIGHFSQAVRFEPGNAEAHYYLGYALAMRDSPRDAIKHLERASQLNPSWIEPIIWRARILAANPDPEVHDPNGAVIIALQAAKLTNYRDPVVLETLAVSYAAAGQFEMAVRSAQEALSLAVTAQNIELADLLRNMIEQYKNKSKSEPIKK